LRSALVCMQSIRQVGSKRSIQIPYLISHVRCVANA
jgi:hypothetical protein